jgi:hypothetical protein
VRIYKKKRITATISTRKVKSKREKSSNFAAAKASAASKSAAAFANNQPKNY